MKTIGIKIKDFLFGEEVKQLNGNEFITNFTQDISQRELSYKEEQIKNLCKEHGIPLNDILSRRCNYRIVVEEKYSGECEIHLCEIKNSKRIKFERNLQVKHN